MSYLEENGVVQYVAAIRTTDRESEPPEGESKYETVPFEEWGRKTITSVAVRAAATHAEKKLDSGDIGGSSSVEVEGEEIASSLKTQTILDREGELVYEQDVDFDALVAATPRSVDATYVLEGQEFSLAIPMYARHEALKQQ